MAGISTSDPTRTVAVGPTGGNVVVGPPASIATQQVAVMSPYSRPPQPVMSAGTVPAYLTAGTPGANLRFGDNLDSIAGSIDNSTVLPTGPTASVTQQPPRTVTPKRPINKPLLAGVLIGGLAIVGGLFWIGAHDPKPPKRKYSPPRRVAGGGAHRRRLAAD